MGNTFKNQHKSTLTKANDCYISYSNYIFDLKTLSSITVLQINELLFKIRDLKNSLDSFKVKSQSEYEQIEILNFELSNTIKTISKYDHNWSKQERLDSAAILSRSNVILDICNYLESMLNKSQAKWKQTRTFYYYFRSFLFFISQIYKFTNL